MGTRGIFGLRIDNNDYLTYNHFDSYPSGLGQDIANFVIENCKDKESLEKIKEQARKLILIDEDKKPTKEQIKKCKAAGIVDLNVSRQSIDDWYCLLREAQGNLKSLLDIGLMIDSHDFIYDSLFCEYGYIVNFDTETLEVYQGFQKEQDINCRYISNELFKDNEYYPCKLFAEIPFKKVTKKTMDKIEGECNKE